MTQEIDIVKPGKIRQIIGSIVTCIGIALVMSSIISMLNINLPWYSIIVGLVLWAVAVLINIEIKLVKDK